MGFCCVLLLLQVLLPLLFSTWQPHCTRLGFQPVHTKGTLETAAHQRWRLVSCVRLASQESNDTKMSTCRHFVHRPYPCTRLGTQPAHTKCTLETAAHPEEEACFMNTMCKSGKRRYEVVDESVLCPKATSLHQTWHPACPHQGHTGVVETASHPWQRPVSCASACAQLVDLEDRMLPGDFTLLVSC